MPVTVRRAYAWDTLADALAAELTATPPGAFEIPRIVVSSAGAGRILSQALAQRFPAGISAGLEFLSPEAWVRRIAVDHGVAEQLDAWRPPALTLTAYRQLRQLAPTHPALAQHLRQGSPHRSYALARRIARLISGYATQDPALLQRWLDGESTDALGA
ncbi:MAG: exodeoxyribonuclease V subunit gamma, partial [Arachnia sp.]